MWEKYDINKIDPEVLDVSSKRFEGQTVLLHELIDNLRYIIFKFFSKNDEPLMSPLEVINKVIVDIKYPLDARGNPTDFHYFQAFRRFLGRCMKTYRNDFDFFQFASETAWMKMGDCEDSSILTAAGLENLKALGQCDYFVSFGAVYYQEQLLGYHGWVVVKINNVWRLVETTLDTPYSSEFEMVSIDINKNKWKVGELLYESFVLFNKEKLWEWVEGDDDYMTCLYEAGDVLKQYLEKTHKEKETKKKYKEMSKAYMKFMNKKTKVK